MLKPLAYPDPGNLVRVSGGANPVRFAELEAQSHSFSGLTAFSGEEILNASGGGEPESLRGVRVSANFLDVLGVRPIVGRSFLPAEDSPGANPVALLSSEFWSRRFQRDPRIAGQTIALAGTPYTIVGVLPPGFAFPSPGIDIWLTRPADWPLMPAPSRALSPFLTIVCRLRPGVAIAQANAEAALLHRRYAAAHPAMLDAKSKAPRELQPWKDELVSGVRGMLWLLFGATGFVLLIACANVAGLLLARSAGRAREFAIRASLGASRRRLFAQLLTESVLLSSAGGALGVLLAVWSLRALPLLSLLPRSGEIQFDGDVLVFAAMLALGSGLIFGLAPSFGAARFDLMRVLRGGSPAVASSAARHLLVVGQVALSVVLLIGAALLFESLARLRAVELGFRPAHLLTLRISLPAARYATDQQKADFFAQLVARVAASPGVSSAAAAMFLPMTGFVGVPVQDAAQPPLRLNERPIAKALIVTPSYFHTLGIPLRRGRDFSAADRSGSDRVAIIDEAAARRFWPSYPNGLDPVGQRLLIGGVSKQPAQIVGIVAEAKQNLTGAAWPETVYLAFAQDPQPSAMLAIRTLGEPLSFSGTIRRQVRALDRDQPVSDLRAMDDLVDEEIGERRMLAILIGGFAAVALLLALLGLYGVIAYSVAQRIPELGIRRALGAQPAHILRFVLGHGLRLTLAGLALGVGGAFALTRLMTKMLFHVSPTDPLTFLGIAVLFPLAALAAAYFPARRALAIDPVTALRNE